MTVSREDLIAYADGELSGENKARVEAEIAADPALAREVEAEQALRSRLSAHFAPLVDEPVPDAWLRIIERATTPRPANDSDASPNAARIVSLDEVREARDKTAVRWRIPAWGTGMAMAASLALGLLIGQPWQASQEPVAMRGNVLVAESDLAKALDSQLADAPGSTQWRVMASFPRQGGGYCRVFGGAAAGGIACQEGDEWRIQHLVPGTSSQTSAYRQAGSDTSGLMALAQDMAAGDPLDAMGERAAMAKGWR